MEFSSLYFLYLFLPLTLLVYFLVPGLRLKNIVLLAASLLFYAMGQPVYVLLLVGLSYANFAMARRIRPGKRNTLFLPVVVNLAVLGLFKYLDFFLGIFGITVADGGVMLAALRGITNGLNSIGFAFRSPTSALPLGLSFYAFQVISYVADVYRGKVKAERSFFNLLLYLSMFPKMMQGPIVRYEQVARQLMDRRTTPRAAFEGAQRFIIGLAKKVLLADYAGKVVASLSTGGGNGTFVGAWLAALMFMFQIYFDFSGYSDMAIGIARIFGFHLDENFRHPFLCKDITEFWQRWHISLGTFFRDYLLYVPLFGKRRKIGGLLLVWFCTGLWHGASWNYIIWGIYYGLFLMLEMGIGKKGMKKIPAVLRHLCNKIVIIVGFGIFYCTGGIDQLGDMLLAMAGQNSTGWLDTMLVTSVQNNLFLLIAALLCCFPLLELPKKIMAKNPAANVALSVTGTVLAAGLLVISSILMVDATNTPFLYTKF